MEGQTIRLFQFGFFLVTDVVGHANKCSTWGPVQGKKNQSKIKAQVAVLSFQSQLRQEQSRSIGIIQKGVNSQDIKQRTNTIILFTIAMPQIFERLLSNLVKATPRSWTIRRGIDTSSTETLWCLSPQHIPLHKCFEWNAWYAPIKCKPSAMPQVYLGQALRKHERNTHPKAKLVAIKAIHRNRTYQGKLPMQCEHFGNTITTTAKITHHFY